MNEFRHRASHGLFVALYFILASFLLAPNAHAAACSGKVGEWALAHGSDGSAEFVTALIAELARVDGVSTCSAPVETGGLLASITGGKAALALVPLTALSDVSPAFARLQVPFAFNDYRAVLKFMSGPGRGLLEAEGRKSGFEMIGLAHSNLFKMTGAGPLFLPEAAAGQRFGWRGSDDLSFWMPLLSATGRALDKGGDGGQQPTVITGTWSDFSDAQTHLPFGIIETNHRLSALLLVAAPAALDGVSVEKRDAVRDDLRKAVRRAYLGEIRKALAVRDKLIAEGVAVWLLPRKARHAWRERLSALMPADTPPELEAAIEEANRPF